VSGGRVVSEPCSPILVVAHTAGAASVTVRASRDAACAP
jgi:hypothetical protein